MQIAIKLLILWILKKLEYRINLNAIEKRNLYHIVYAQDAGHP